MQLQASLFVYLAAATLSVSASPLAVPKDHNLNARGLHHASQRSEDLPIVIPPPKWPRDIQDSEGKDTVEPISEDIPIVIPPPRPNVAEAAEKEERPRWTVTQILARVLQAAREENANAQVKRRRRRAHP